MHNDDFSKIPPTNYVRVEMQQGRVQLDSDANENNKLEKNEVRKRIDLHVKTFIEEVNSKVQGDLKSADIPPNGFRTLLYGPPNTGKTSTAELMAKQLNKELHKVDLSTVVSEYIGETEKNLELLLARAEENGWILFFDEADALFGKRTQVKDSHDRYTNEQVSYLLERILNYPGLIIMCSDSTDIDTTLPVKFDKVIRFPVLPGT